MLQRAAALSGRTLSEFVVASAQDAANKVIQDHAAIELSRSEQIAFVSALLDPPKSSARLRRAAAAYRQQVGLRLPDKAPPGYRVEALERRHDRGDFTCGAEALDHCLHQQARQDADKRVAAPFVLVKPPSSRVLGYYTLSASLIRANDLPEVGKPLGLSQFSMRGLHRVQVEWKPVCTALNLRRMATMQTG